MGIIKSDFGKLKTGQTVEMYKLINSKGMSAEIINFGAILRALCVPDKDGKLIDVVHGFDDVISYEDMNYTFYGSTIGRCGNRIGNAEFILNGIKYNLDKNDGINNLHGGFNGYEHRLFIVDEVKDDREPSLTLYLFSTDMDQGFPGNLDFYVTYKLTDNNELVIRYKAVSDKDTIINPTNHSYFNLEGDSSDSILDQYVKIYADSYTDADAMSIPTGKIISVKDTPMDFLDFHTIGERIEDNYEALKFGAGYDHNYCVNPQCEFKLVCEMKSLKTGIHMQVESDLPGMQLYVGNFIKGNQTGKNKKVYMRRSGACFETQYYPDAINHDNFKKPVFKAGEIMNSKTIYRFKNL